jgi:ribosomal protein S18 acetylase RimI-like enzyme
MPSADFTGGHPELTLRPGRAGDLALLVALEQRLFGSDRLSRRSFAHFLRSAHAALIVAEIGEALAGYALVLFRPRSRIARLYSIAVAPENGRRGLGGTLLEAAAEAAQGRGSSCVRLEVNERNGGATALYHRHGYRLIGQRLGYYHDGSTALRMEKTLA